MSEIRNVSAAAIVIPSLGVTAEAGDTITVPTELADELCGRPEWRPAGAAKVPTVAEVLGDVDGDPDRAQVALDAEQARGDKARTTLVADLQAIIDSATADTQEDDQ